MKRDMLLREASEIWQKSRAPCDNGAKRMKNFLETRKGVILSEVESPHVFKIKVSGYKMDTINYNKACEFVDCFLDKYFASSHPELSRPLHEAMQNDRFRSLVAGRNVAGNTENGGDPTAVADAMLEDPAFKAFF